MGGGWMNGACEGHENTQAKDLVIGLAKGVTEAAIDMSSDLAARAAIPVATREGIHAATRGKCLAICSGRCQECRAAATGGSAGVRMAGLVASVSVTATTEKEETGEWISDRASKPILAKREIVMLIATPLPLAGASAAGASAAATGRATEALIVLMWGGMETGEAVWRQPQTPCPPNA